MYICLSHCKMILTRVMVARDSTLFKFKVKNKGINYQIDINELSAFGKPETHFHSNPFHWLIIWWRRKKRERNWKFPYTCLTGESVWKCPLNLSACLPCAKERKHALPTLETKLDFFFFTCLIGKKQKRQIWCDWDEGLFSVKWKKRVKFILKNQWDVSKNTALKCDVPEHVL